MKRKTDTLWDLAWQQLVRANNDRKHPFRVAVISTVDQNGFPRARNVVMRKANRQEGSLLLYTDLRSRKIKEWQHSGTLHWLFWNPKSQLQVGARGTVERVDRAQELALFHQLPKHGRKSYATMQAPAAVGPTTPDGLPEDWPEMTIESTDYAADNFGVFKTNMLTFDILQLSRNEGHRRIAAERATVAEDWSLSRITP